jgi:hypothetical protein
MISEPPICMWCKHYHFKGRTPCNAFPDRIPDEIWFHRNPHIEPFTGNHGLQFELDEKQDKIVRLPSDFRRLLRARTRSQ